VPLNLVDVSGEQHDEWKVGTPTEYALKQRCHISFKPDFDYDQNTTTKIKVEQIDSDKIGHGEQSAQTSPSRSIEERTERTLNNALFDSLLTILFSLDISLFLYEQK
jgi:hypothetical protein